MANIEIPPPVRTEDKEIQKAWESMRRAIRQIKEETERLEREKQNKT